MPEAYAPEIAAWEAFFNGDSLKEQLMSRYMFEHLFLANIYFDELGTDEHFRLVRSTTPPGQPIDIIATRRPYDDPEWRGRIIACSAIATRWSRKRTWRTRSTRSDCNA